MELNVSNIPLNTIYRFDTNKYVMATLSDKTRKDEFPLGKEQRILEVHYFDNDGNFLLRASGPFVDKPDVYDYTHQFAINDYDQGELLTFAVTMRLQELSLEELIETGAAIRNNRNKTR